MERFLSLNGHISQNVRKWILILKEESSQIFLSIIQTKDTREVSS
jgi:hypothetical protein